MSPKLGASKLAAMLALLLAMAIHVPASTNGPFGPLTCLLA